jgi:hypothetical protein
VHIPTLLSNTIKYDVCPYIIWEKRQQKCATNYPYAFLVILHTSLMIIYCRYKYIAAKVIVLRICCTAEKKIFLLFH